MRIAAAAVTAVLVLGLSGCGSDEEGQAREALATSLLASNADGTFEVSQEEADCVADGMVEEIGVDKLIDYGLLTEDLEARDESLENQELEQEDADSAATVFVDCVDVQALLTDSIAQGLGGDVDPELASCIEERLTDEVVRDFLATVFTGDQAAATQAVTQELSSCLTA
ncbi:hypothetical protein [Nocardioides coralli]|uniref:hypothetical protein n=1 Tax=Nocardioides coralli TaxID=2872154 RepID=UPI001CA452E6|nr:hypothetical protein [Nocardioides coralli]QZY30283.1 hypothetical protein K6T13_06330 [Nocardioides coralli]